MTILPQFIYLPLCHEAQIFHLWPWPHFSTCGLQKKLIKKFCPEKMLCKFGEGSSIPSFNIVITFKSLVVDLDLISCNITLKIELIQDVNPLKISWKFEEAISILSFVILSPSLYCYLMTLTSFLDIWLWKRNSFKRLTI